MTQCSC